MRFSGSVFRTIDPRWASDPLSSEGARVHGGCFNPIGVPALYTSLTYEGAMRERIGLARTQPVITCEYEVDIEPIFDSFSEEDSKALGIRPADLDCAWEDAISLGETPASHLVASKLISSGYAGLLVKSCALAAGKNDINLVLWNYRDELPQKINVIDDESMLKKLRLLNSSLERIL